MPGKTGSAWFIYNKWQDISTICKLFEHNIWWNWLKFSDKMDLTMQIRIVNDEKHCHAIFLKFGTRPFTPLTTLLHEVKASICSTTKENPILYCRTFSAFVVAVINCIF